ncbi:uncharacterized protein LOC132057591 [Lycium ferocissimum]|uniref:uncharacterized protein LOC132057591 n=1 Tax=Lycium ferocissimum TaxID=112874 RepID=UPI0028154484|nr:uncharacterized protein LOC132057591 [Lycium ferocissimum]
MTHHLPWIVGGDFNVILSEEAKQRGLPVLQQETVDFSQFIRNCGLAELKFSGSKFTWWNGRIEGDCIFKRLDRVLGNQEFLQFLPSSEVFHLIRDGSDHAPLHVVCDSNEEAKMKRVKKALASWSKETYGNIFQQISTLEDVIKVKELQLELNPTGLNREELHKAQVDLNRYLTIEEEYWKQKSGMKWFKDGERNIKFFHSYVKGRRRKLALHGIHNSQGDWITNKEEIGEEVRPTNFDMLDDIPSLITAEQNDALIELPDNDEVKKVVFGLNGENTSGPDGFSGHFFQACWNIVGTDVVKMVRAFFCGQELGDPLSPTLFIIVAEVLARGLNKLHENAAFRGYGLPKWSPQINHLSYANDTIMFCSVESKSLKLMMKVLRNYENTPGQMINNAKSSFYVHEKTPVSVIGRVKRRTGMNKGSFPFTYLGCPIFYGRRKSVYFEELIKKVKKRVMSWKNRFLSFGGRYILISHVLQTMPVYLLPVMNPLKGVIKQLHRIFAKFFWSNTLGVKSRHWVAWDSMCYPKNEGGVGFRSLHDISKALFAKLWWNLRTCPLLCGACMVNKYCKKLHPTIAQAKGAFSIKAGNSSFWFDNWTKLGALYFVVEDHAREEKIELKNFIEDRQWSHTKLRVVLPEDIVQHIIQNIKPYLQQVDNDIAWWINTNNGEFTVKSAWDQLRQRNQEEVQFSFIWTKKLPIKIYFFLWRLWNGRISTDDNLQRLRIPIVSRCWCGMTIEGLQLHQIIKKWWTMEAPTKLRPVYAAVPAIIVWEIWKWRNSIKHGGNRSANGMVFQVQKTILQFVKAQYPWITAILKEWPAIILMLI